MKIKSNHVPLRVLLAPIFTKLFCDGFASIYWNNLLRAIRFASTNKSHLTSNTKPCGVKKNRRVIWNLAPSAIGRWPFRRKAVCFVSMSVRRALRWDWSLSERQCSTCRDGPPTSPSPSPGRLVSALTSPVTSHAKCMNLGNSCD